MRLKNWESALSDEIGRWAAVRFVWGKTDCCRFGAACVKAQTGKDPMRGLRGRCSTKTGALRMLAEQPLEAWLDSRFKRVAPAFAKRGDIVMAHGNVGVVWAGAALFVGQEGARAGLVSFPIRDWSGAWQVG